MLCNDWIRFQFQTQKSWHLITLRRNTLRDCTSETTAVTRMRPCQSLYDHLCRGNRCFRFEKALLCVERVTNDDVRRCRAYKPGVQSSIAVFQTFDDKSAVSSPISTSLPFVNGLSEYDVFGRENLVASFWSGNGEFYADFKIEWLRAVIYERL